MQASSIDYRISANTAADACSPHGIAASRSTLRLAVLGLSPGERQLLRAIVDVLDSRTEARWELVDDDSDCDLRLHRPGIDLPHAPAALTGLVLSEDESMPAEPGVRLIMPPRVMAVMELLNDAHDRLRQPRVEPAVDELIEAEADDGKSLASALARLLENRLEHSLRARIVGHGTLFLCRQARTFCTDFPLSQLQDATVAQWVASNVLAETRLTGRPPAQGRAEGQVDMAGRSWRWQLDAKATDEPGLVRLDVRVYDRAVSDGSTASSLTGFMQL